MRVVLNDGRNVLLATRQTFDVILSDSTAPGPAAVRWAAVSDPKLAPTLAEAGVRTPAALAAVLLLGPGDAAVRRELRQLSRRAARR